MSPARRYIAALSHDFGTPIAALDLALRSLDSAAEAAVGDEVLSGMRAAVRTLSIVKNKALHLSFIKTGETLKPNQTATSVRALLVEVEDLARLMYKRAGVSVRFWVDPDVAKFILTDRDCHTDSGRHDVTAATQSTARARRARDSRRKQRLPETAYPKLAK